MGKSQDSNVIQLINPDRDQGPDTSTDGLRLLRTCRDYLIDALLAAFTRQVGRANEELLAMMDQPIDQTQSQLCFDARAFLSNRSPAMLQRFRETYIETFDQAVTRLRSQEARPAAVLTGELSLVDDSDFELDLALTKLTTRSAYHCAQSMVALDRRVAVLLNLPRLAQEDNPFYPMMIYRALLQALTDLGVVRDLAIFILQVFEHQVVADLPAIYAEINRQLVESGILPQIPLSGVQAKGEAGAPGVSVTGPASAVQAGLGAGGIPTGGGAVGTQTGDVFEELWHSWRRLAAAPAASSLPPVVGAALPLAPGVPAVPLVPPTQAAPPTLPRDQLFQTLGNLQRGALDPSAWPTLGAVPLDPSAVNVVAQLRASPELRQTSALDSMVIDIVAMLFDAVFKDPELPDAVRAEIAKLQIPILKVALLDKTFFSDRKHPARRLLDVLAESYLGRGEQEMQSLLAKIRAVVKAVLDDFESDIGVFSAQVEQFEGFLAEEESKTKAASAALLADLARRERQGLAEQRVSSEIQRRIQRPGIPDLISDFLQRGWSWVLSDTFINQSDDSPEWRQALQLMDDLIWSITPKTNTAERERLIVMLPNLIQGLRSALARLGLEKEWGEFFSNLIQCHVAAIRGESASEHPETGVSNRLPPRPEPITTSVTSERDKEPLTAQRDKEATQTTTSHHLKLVQSLQPGAWIEFQTERGTRKTLRLSWVSDFKGVFLFTNRQGENAITLAAASLAEHLRKGSARLLSQNPLTDRAVARIMEQMQAQTPSPSAGSQTQDPSGPQSPGP
ncbi:DUF1631 domain-containing protein [Caldichromatium japonicum]|uniref:DUF1631 domain-containing protein n=1 Tax=Caldichromatium japonicum TaxID=2699430 RepID=A0A6G7VG17_9GAMM|nr:DUF1631 domain-containing protein [Caldichromatium japonicum]QIK38850.1 DUF1631 domain-containing protein [Caldichromatium japonicum]